MAKKKEKKEKKTKTADARRSSQSGNNLVVLSATVAAAIALFLAAGNNDVDATNLLQRVTDLFINKLFIFLPHSKQEDYDLLVFHKWFRENGGWIHPNLTLTMIPGYGKGLIAAKGLIESRETILVIPEDLILSKQFALERLFRKLKVNSQGGTAAALRDVGDLEIIALALTMEKCKHEESFFAPYLDVLPKEDPPLLFTFNEPALALLQDEALARMARLTLSRLERVWKDVLAPAVTRLALLPLSSTEHQEFDQSCASFATFRRYYAIVSSHTMILNGVPYLVPMADMINHHHHHHHDVDERTTSDRILPLSFADVHNRDSQTGAVTVQADRRTVESHQLVEEYGPLDNSLYLVSFGFVPIDNPYHCVMLRYAHFSPLTSTDLQQVLKRLDPFSFDDNSNNGASLCVRRDFGLLDEQLTEIYPVLYSLDSEELYVSQKNQCLTTAQHDDDDDNRNDSALLERLVAVHMQQQKQHQPNNRDSRHAILAIQFRIEEKSILVALSHHDDDDEDD